jgi:hypothetical protein
MYVIVFPRHPLGKGGATMERFLRDLLVSALGGLLAGVILRYLLR